MWLYVWKFVLDKLMWGCIDFLFVYNVDSFKCFFRVKMLVVYLIIFVMGVYFMMYFVFMVGILEVLCVLVVFYFRFEILIDFRMKLFDILSLF